MPWCFHEIKDATTSSPSCMLDKYLRSLQEFIFCVCIRSKQINKKLVQVFSDPFYFKDSVYLIILISYQEHGDHQQTCQIKIFEGHKVNKKIVFNCRELISAITILATKSNKVNNYVICILVNSICCFLI